MFLRFHCVKVCQRKY